jgi:hypothetical protein
VLAHLVGLVALAAYFAIGSDSVADDFGFFFLIAGAVSLPVLAGVLVLVVLFARWVDDNLMAFVLAGPMLVCLGGGFLAGLEVVGLLAIAATSASLVFGALTFFDWPATMSRGS